MNSEMSNESPEPITIGDLKAVVRLIDIMAQRGAIQPIEMKGVGIIYERIAKFVTLSEKIEEQKEINQDKSP